MSASVVQRRSAAAPQSRRDEDGHAPGAVSVSSSSSSSSSPGSASNGGGGGTAAPPGVPFRRPPPLRQNSKNRARRLAAVRRKNSKPFVSIHPDEVFHLALLGFSLFTIGAVVVYRWGHERSAAAMAGGDPAVDDLPGADGSSPTLRTNPSARNERRGGGRGGGGKRGILGGLFGGGGSPAKKPCEESLDHVGDKSRHYYEFRQEYEALLPFDKERTLEFVRGLRKRDYESMYGPDDVGYDIHNCPLYPPKGYPAQWKALDVLEAWPSHETNPEVQPKLHQGLCVFDYDTELEKAKNYREAEVPFVVRDDPSFLRTAERWNQPGYMEGMLGPVPHRTEYSPNNHFMYWMNPKAGKKKKPNGGGGRKMPKIKEPEGWTPPTKLIRMKYSEWVEHANTTDDKLGPDNPHWYYRLIGCGEMGKCDKDSSEYLFDEIPNFQPKDDNFYIVEPGRQKGIHCRFGMKGVIAENHFDGSRNTIALFGGERRYILGHPNQCNNFALFPKGHPSARHSAVDWTDPDLDEYPQFKDAEVNEVVMQAGDALYLPTNWFHYIVSLELNFQCNSRSGINTEYMDPIKRCGF